jgi:hypothetical protein
MLRWAPSSHRPVPDRWLSGLALSMYAAALQVMLCHHPVESGAPQSHLTDSTTHMRATSVPAVHRVAHTPYAPTATVRLLAITVDALHLLSPHPYHSSATAAVATGASPAAAASITTSTLRLVTRHATATATMAALLRGCTVLQAGEAAAAVTGTLHGVAATVHCAAAGQSSTGMVCGGQTHAGSAEGEYELKIHGGSVAVVAALRHAVLHRCCAERSSFAAQGVDTALGGFREAAASRASEGFRERRKLGGVLGEGDHGEGGRTDSTVFEYCGRRLLVTAREEQLTALEKLQRHVAALSDATDSCERLWALAIGTAPEQRAGESSIIHKPQRHAQLPPGGVQGWRACIPTRRVRLPPPVGYHQLPEGSFHLLT